MSSNTVTYQGVGSTVVLDIAEATVAIEHFPPSEHSGIWVVPLIEVVDVHYREHTVEHDGWAQIRTVTSQHPDELAADPYAFRNGGEQLRTFCLLVAYAARHVQMAVEGHAAREVIGEEMASVRAMLDELRGG